jgi:hypothetical protein
MHVQWSGVTDSACQLQFATVRIVDVLTDAELLSSPKLQTTLGAGSWLVSPAQYAMLPNQTTMQVGAGVCWRGSGRSWHRGAQSSPH